MIELKNISHFYVEGEQVLHNISLNISAGEFLFLSGESGSGKSTLLSILSTLLKPSKGELLIDKVNVKEIKNIDNFRQENVGFVFQFHFLINYLNVYENIALAAKEKHKKDINELLEKLGILDLAKRYPNEISGGQRQRVALARSLINKPKIIFADEPTGSLDSKNSTLVYELLKTASDAGTTVVVASHDLAIKNYATRTIKMIDGKL
ncbi:ABC transporter ATP-binding protein [Sulfurimonas lithotrophica]|uniref:ABC transporter ATP-binding protein n=1 Tax=Sulfurimonas lithotrophica TaxID=2590022 RepID=A0A5P8NXY9_9BACT|nr:ABC transporter ATP-binding protein [Sulfurimonas lithotrophica]QFR48277.1 ABC transporter ATP-binding protein [Sulfurimonas lithotrophica]